MSQQVVIHCLTLISEFIDDVADPGGVPVQNGIGHKAETTGLVHDFFIVACGEFTLIRKEYPARQFMSVFPFIQLPLAGLTEFFVSQVPQSVFGLANQPQVREGCGAAIRGGRPG